MMNTSDRPKAVVIGAGFSGLVTAYYLERAGYSVEVYERTEREGGLLGTTATEFGPSERAANAFLNSVRIEALFADLGIKLVPARKVSRARFIFRAGRPRRWPIGFSGSLRLVGFLFRFIFRRPSVSPRPAESLADWGRRVLGEEATEYLLLPVFQGIYAGDGNRLSATLLLAGVFGTHVAPRPRVHGSVSAGGGMGEVTRRLRATLESRGAVFHFRAPGPLERKPEVLTFFCGSASEAAESLAKIDPGLSRLLGRIEMLPVTSVTAFFPRDPRIEPGFGVLFPPREEFRSLGVLYNHDIFPGRVTRDDLRSETWILGGARRPEVSGYEADRIAGEFLEDRKRLHGEGGGETPIHHLVHRWPRALPYYTVEMEEVLDEISRRNLDSGKLRLMGNYLGGIGLAKILDRAAGEIAKASSL